MAGIKKGGKAYRRRVAARTKFKKLGQQVMDAYGLTNYNQLASALDISPSCAYEWMQDQSLPNRQGAHYKRAINTLERMLSEVHQAPEPQQHDMLVDQGPVLEEMAEPPQPEQRSSSGLLWYLGGIATGAALFGAAAAAGMVGGL